MSKILKIFAMAMVLMPAVCQAQLAEEEPDNNIFHKMSRHGVFNRLEVAANIGTTGLGLEVASPVTKWAKLRVGVDYMPHFVVPMNFGLDSYVNGNVSGKFDRIRELMYEVSGMEIDREVRMESRPSLTTLRVLVDVYPFRNRHWHLTAGFFYGGDCMGKSVNKMNEMPSLLALKMYDRMYDVVMAEDFVEKIMDRPIFDNVYLDPEVAMKMQEKFAAYGELGIHVGDHKDGTPYMMMPDEDGTVSAKAKVWRFRPYVGFGYGGFMDRDKHWHASLDAGVQFWGGCPKVTTHDGTVLNDLDNLRGKVGTYMDMMRKLVVYPTIDFRLAYCF